MESIYLCSEKIKFVQNDLTMAMKTPARLRAIIVGTSLSVGKQIMQIFILSLSLEKRKALYEMDGTQHVVKGTKYPAIICVGGWNDSSVSPWQPGKFAAALQNASSSGKPVLLKINYDNGHFTEDKNVTYANFANQYAFVLWQCGHPDFQPKK